MDQYFTSQQAGLDQSKGVGAGQTRFQQQELGYVQHDEPDSNPSAAFQYNAFQNNNFEAARPSEGHNENEFNQFQEDEVTKRIRAEEERIQLVLKSRSEKEWEDKNKKREEGRRVLQQFLGNKQQEKAERVKDNLRKEAIYKQQIGRLNVEAGWKKVITNINMRQGEHKGTKEINRMREAILHRRQDDSR